MCRALKSVFHLLRKFFNHFLLSLSLCKWLVILRSIPIKASRHRFESLESSNRCDESQISFHYIVFVLTSCQWVELEANDCSIRCKTNTLAILWIRVEYKSHATHWHSFVRVLNQNMRRMWNDWNNTQAVQNYRDGFPIIWNEYWKDIEKEVKENRRREEEVKRKRGKEWELKREREGEEKRRKWEELFLY